MATVSACDIVRRINRVVAGVIVAGVAPRVETWEVGLRDTVAD